MKPKDNSQQYVTLGPVGGMGGSATAGGYNQGNMIAGVHASGDSSPRMAGKITTGVDIRVNAFVPGAAGPDTAAPPGVFHQGDVQAAAKQPGFGTSGTPATGQIGGAKAGGNALGTVLDNQGNPKAAPGQTGYAQGDMFAGQKK